MTNGFEWLERKIASSAPHILLENECFNHTYQQQEKKLLHILICIIEYFRILFVCFYYERRKKLKLLMKFVVWGWNNKSHKTKTYSAWIMSFFWHVHHLSLIKTREHCSFSVFFFLFFKNCHNFIGYRYYMRKDEKVLTELLMKLKQFFSIFRLLSTKLIAFARFADVTKKHQTCIDIQKNVYHMYCVKYAEIISMSLFCAWGPMLLVE